MRHVILHHHIFKNAGSSIDRVLQSNFPGRWEQIEKSDVADPDAPFEAALELFPDAAAISSHTARIRPIVVPGVLTYPIVFVRHPIDRLRSVYEFELRRRSEAAVGRNLSEYVKERLESGDLSFRSFQTLRLAPFAGTDGPVLERALRALEALPVVGVVEEFAQSIECIAERVREFGFGSFRADALHVNRSPRAEALSDRIRQVEQELSREVADRFLALNQDDFSLYSAACERLAQIASSRRYHRIA